MTRAELDAVWQRYMHRNDIDTDLDTVFDLTGQKIREQLLSIATVDLVTILQDHASLYVHGGLAYLHELAQDDEGAMREITLFDDALSDFSYWWSVHNNATISPTNYTVPGSEEAP